MPVGHQGETPNRQKATWVCRPEKRFGLGRSGLWAATEGTEYGRELGECKEMQERRGQGLPGNYLKG